MSLSDERVNIISADDGMKKIICDYCKASPNVFSIGHKKDVTFCCDCVHCVIHALVNICHREFLKGGKS